MIIYIKSPLKCGGCGSYISQTQSCPCDARLYTQVTELDVSLLLENGAVVIEDAAQNRTLYFLEKENRIFVTEDIAFLKEGKIYGDYEMSKTDVENFLSGNSGIDVFELQKMLIQSRKDKSTSFEQEISRKYKRVTSERNIDLGAVDI